MGRRERTTYANTIPAPTALEQKQRRKLNFKRNLPLYAMLIVPLAYYAIFRYGPMFGLIMAFENYKIRDGFFGSKFVGLANFKLIFSSPNMYRIILNTLRLGILTVLVTFPFPIIIAIMLNEVSNRIFKKVSQTIIYMPHFFSWVVLGGMIITLFSQKGPVNSLIESLGGSRIPFLTKPVPWTVIYLLSSVWKDSGYNAIIYLAALTNIDPALYEAASMDGATKWQKIRYITLPELASTCVLMLILNIGRITSVSFDKIYVMTNPAVSSVSNVVSVFTYEFGVRSGNYSIATAMGLFDSLLSLILVLFTNWLAKKTDNALF